MPWCGNLPFRGVGRYFTPRGGSAQSPDTGGSRQVTKEALFSASPAFRRALPEGRSWGQAPSAQSCFPEPLSQGLAVPAQGQQL